MLCFLSCATILCKLCLFFPLPLCSYDYDKHNDTWPIFAYCSSIYRLRSPVRTKRFKSGTFTYAKQQAGKNPFLLVQRYPCSHCQGDLDSLHKDDRCNNFFKNSLSCLLLKKSYTPSTTQERTSKIYPAYHSVQPCVDMFSPLEFICSISIFCRAFVLQRILRSVV